jgi:hypothetical protein
LHPLCSGLWGHFVLVDEQPVCHRLPSYMPCKVSRSLPWRNTLRNFSGVVLALLEGDCCFPLPRKIFTGWLAKLVHSNLVFLPTLRVRNRCLFPPLCSGLVDLTLHLHLSLDILLGKLMAQHGRGHLIKIKPASIFFSAAAARHLFIPF